MTGCHAAQVWEVELFARLFSLLWAFAYSVTIHFKALATELRTQAAESSRLNVTWAKREASPCKTTALVAVGLRRPEMARTASHTASHTAPGSVLCLSTSPMPCTPQRWPTVTSLFSHPLPLHGKLTMSLFPLHAEPPLAHSHILGLQTFTTMLSTGNSPTICTEAK